MSIQAVAWALEQDIPGTAKLVLISLANRADHVTGHCWPSMERIAKEASCSRRSVFTYIGALKRNGYLDVKSRRGVEGAQRTNDYWLLMEREPREWDFGKSGPPNNPEPQDIGDGATVAHSPEAETSAPIAPGLCATRLPTIEPSDSNHQDSLPREESERRSVAMRPALHDPTARRADQKRHRAADEARKPKMVPVIQGTRAWAAWIRQGHKPTLVTNIVQNGESKRGWYFPSLFPQGTGPPIEELADELDDETIAAE